MAVTLPKDTQGYAYVGDDDGTGKVIISTKITGSNALYAGTASLTTVAAAIGSSQACSAVLVQNDPDNTVDIFVGNSTTQPLQLTPGQSATIPVSNVNLVYAKSASGTPTLNWLAQG